MKALLIFLAVLSFSRSGESQWTRLNTGVQIQLRSVFFLNEHTGWACGFGKVIKTTDAGISWTQIQLSGSHKAIAFKDENTGFVCGEAGKIFKSVNGGVSWQALQPGVSVTLNSISIAPDGALIVPGNNTLLLRSTDNGSTWADILDIPALLDFFAVKTISSSDFIVTGNESTILRTRDTGQTWESISTGMPNPLFAVDFAGQSTGWVTGCCGMFMKTTNAGISWSVDDYLTPGFTIYSMKFFGASKGFLAGEAGYILRTTNAGANWDSLNSGTGLDLFSMHFINENTGYVSGHDGVVLKTTNGGGAGTPIGISRNTESTGSYELFQNYPNPFNPRTAIRFELGKRSETELRVYDVKGMLVSEEKFGVLPPGTHSFLLDGTDLPSGVYFSQLVTDNTEIRTIKMLLLK